MKKLVIAASVLAALAAPAASAAIELDGAGKVQMFGDFRLRAEYDDRTKMNNGVDQDRNRLRYRARLGVGYQVNDNWSAKVRLATGVSSINSPHITFGKDSDIGFDQAYLTYKAADMKVGAGQQALNFWQSSEMLWDKDFNPAAVTYTNKFSGITLNAAHIIINEGSWGNSDDTIEFLQAVYNAGDMTGAIGFFNVNDGSVAEVITSFAGQYKTSAMRIVVEIASSDADQENLAYAIQFRKNLGNGKGLRIYYLHVEAQSIPGDGRYGQDDFPDQNSAGLSNFEGFRLQYDQKIDKNIAMDVRLYSMKAIDATFAGLAGPGIAYFADDDRLRLQLNINLKF
jgi:hypothetical protein